jgi:hypothetical protein
MPCTQHHGFVRNTRSRYREEEQEQEETYHQIDQGADDQGEVSSQMRIGDVASDDGGQVACAIADGEDVEGHNLVEMELLGEVQDHAEEEADGGELVADLVACKMSKLQILVKPWNQFPLPELPDHAAQRKKKKKKKKKKGFLASYIDQFPLPKLNAMSHVSRTRKDLWLHVSICVCTSFHIRSC